MSEERIEEEYADEQGKFDLRFFYDNMIEKLSDPSFHKTAIWATGSIILALVVGALVMVMTGYNVGLGFLTLLYGAITQFDRVLFFATPLVFTGLSVALAFKCGLFNIGPEGQLYMGAMAAAIIGYMFSLPIVIHQITALLFGAFAGFLYGLLPGILKAYRGTHEVVTTMMMSYSAILFTAWLVTYPLKDTSQALDRTPEILATAELPKLVGYFLNASFIVAILAVIAVDYLINRTVLGYEMRAVGQNKDAAETAGINPKKNIALALGIAGALAGMGGSGEILGYHHLFQDNWSVGLGWDGITVAVLGNNNPWGVLAAAIFFGALRTGGIQMQRIAGIPLEMVRVIQGLIVLFIAAPKAIDWLAKRGSDYAIWLRTDRVPAFIHLFTTGMAGTSAIFCLTLFGSYASLLDASVSNSGGSIALLLFLTSLISMFALVELASRSRRGVILVVFAAIEWLLIAAMGIVAGVMVIVGQSLVFGITIILLVVVGSRIFPEDLYESGGEG
ncbi:MAG: ABC transporter permease [Candidatus Thorarchaeota archaeon]